jgi:hypothetical protein
MREALDNIEKAVAKNYVDAVEENDDGGPEFVVDKAWGVWVQPPEIDPRTERREGQYGILGTSAGLELMASSRDFRNDIADPERRDLILKSWRYLHRSLKPATGAPRADREGLDGSEDYRRTLAVRQSQVLRCLSALDHHISALSSGGVGELSLHENRKLAEQTLDELSRCREPNPDMSKLPDLVGLGEDAVTVYRFSSQLAAGTDENKGTLPKAPIEWAYLWGSVLVGLTRSYLANFLDAERFNELVKPDELDQLASWATSVAVQIDKPDELRVGLFVGWAILQLEELFTDEPDRSLANLHTGGTGTIVDDHRHHLEARPSVKQSRKLRNALLKGATRVMREPALRGDLHHPYSFHITVEEKGSPDKFRQDHLVVPTLPIAIWLKSRLDPRALFNQDFEKCARDIAAAFDNVEKKTWRGVAPAQSSTFNGTVNMNYIHEAVAEVHDLALRTKREPAAWRVQAFARSWVKSFSRVVNHPKFALIYGTVLLLIGAPMAVLWGLAGVGPSQVTHVTNNYGSQMSQSAAADNKGSHGASGQTAVSDTKKRNRAKRGEDRRSAREQH